MLFPFLASVAGCHPAGAGASAEEPSYRFESWMSVFPSETPLTALSIPGSHNAAARYEPLAGTAACQTLSVEEQLRAGVRFLDIRCRHVRDGFRIHHGMVDQRQDFGEVQAACLRFLDAHPTETVIVSVQQEHTPSENSRPFAASFDASVKPHVDRWHLAPHVPTLGQARGKMVLLRRFAAEGAKGLDASRWADNTTFTLRNAATIRVQDKYRVATAEEKWDAASALLTEAPDGPADVLYLHFASGYLPRAFEIPNIPGVSQPVTANLHRFLQSTGRARLGIVITDFSSAETSRLIIDTNF